MTTQGGGKRPAQGIVNIAQIDEGTILDMPVTIPRASITQVADDLKARDALLRTFPEVELTLSVDGFGNPYVKTWKYNALVDEATPFTSFKLFYGWDDPLMTPAQALGVDASEHTDFIEITPNMIQYQ